MQGGPRALIGTGPFIGNSALNRRGRDVQLRMGARVFVPTSTLASAPTFMVQGQSSAFGFYMDGSNLSFNYVYASVIQAMFANTGVAVGSGLRIGFCSTAGATVTQDTFFMRQALGVMQQGVDAAAPVHQALKGHNGSGTNIAGANLNLAGGAGTGTGRGGDVVLRTHDSTTSGSTAQTAASNPRYQAVAKPVVLTSGVVTTLCTFNVGGSGKFLGLVVDVTIFATGSGGYQALVSRLLISAVMPSTTVTATIVQDDGTVALSSGTLTPVTYTVVDAGSGNLQLRVTATTSLGTPTMEARMVVVSRSSNASEAVTATSLITPA